MINQVYKLKSPRQFEVAYSDVLIDEKTVIVRPTHLSICAADQRYYQGNRAPKILAQKLPMALIHEGIGEIIYDPTGTFDDNDLVVIIPNLPTDDDALIAENYLRSSKFMSSSKDGLLQDYILVPYHRLVKLPRDINRHVASFTELVSVSVHAITRLAKVSHERLEHIGVWGDGNLGYITALLIKNLYPNSKVYVFGKNEDKLNYFTFVDEVYNIDEVPSHLKLDHAFECVGGNGSQIAINQIIDVINPEGTISLLGVSELNVEINTRMILEKGIKLIGNSRSGKLDFERTVEIYTKHPIILNYLENLVGDVVTVRDIKDINQAFELDIKNRWGKTVMKWEK